MQMEEGVLGKSYFIPLLCFQGYTHGHERMVPLQMQKAVPTSKWFGAPGWLSWLRFQLLLRS